MNNSNMLNSKSSSSLISTNSIEKNLVHIFEDSIILSTRFTIVNVSPSILHLLNYQEHTLIGESINYLAPDADLEQKMVLKFADGYFQEEEFTVKTGYGHSLILGISGFYLGLLSDINGYIILKIKNLHEVKKVYEQLEQASLELDHFLYRTSHDLRGPLATIMGLVNVARISTDEQEKKYLFNEIGRFSQKLDETLRNLLYVADADWEESIGDGWFGIDQMEDALRSLIKDHAMSRQLTFDFKATGITLFDINNKLFVALVKNLMVAIMELPVYTDNPELCMELQSNEHFLSVQLDYTGFAMNKELANRITQGDLSCVEVLRNGPLVRFYAVKKILSRIKGTIMPTLHAGKQSLLITIPKQFKRTAK